MTRFFIIGSNPAVRAIILFILLFHLIYEIVLWSLIKTTSTTITEVAIVVIILIQLRSDMFFQE